MNVDQADAYPARHPPYTAANQRLVQSDGGRYCVGPKLSTSVPDGRRARMGPLSPSASSADIQRKYADPPPGTAFVYQAMSPTLPRLDELFASEQLIAPHTTTGRTGGERRLETDDHARHDRPSGASLSLERYALSRKMVQPETKPVAQQPMHFHGASPQDRIPTHATPPDSAERAAQHRSAGYHRDHEAPERAIRVDELLSPAEQRSRCGYPAPVDFRSASTSPEIPHADRHDSPVEEGSWVSHAPQTATFTPATYVYPAAAFQQDLSGLGPHSFYPGGLCIPTHAPPLWGLARGKLPRKRLSVACQTCRAKKIRCEPSYDGCLQCQKAEKPCRVEPVRRRRPKRTESPERGEGTANSTCDRRSPP